jgi:hypothetical protein
MAIINLPEELFTIIDEYANTKITFKQYKRKKTTNPVIKTIKYKCNLCAKYKNHRQIQHFSILYHCATKHQLIMDRCKKRTCYNDLQVANSYKILSDRYRILDTSRYTEAYGYNYKNIINYNNVVNRLAYHFAFIREYNNKDEWHYNQFMVNNNFKSNKRFIKPVQKIRFKGNEINKPTLHYKLYGLSRTF